MQHTQSGSQEGKQPVQSLREPTSIDKQTGISLGLLLGIIGSLLVLTLFAATDRITVGDRIARLETAVQSLSDVKVSLRDTTSELNSVKQSLYRMEGLLRTQTTLQTNRLPGPDG